MSEVCVIGDAGYPAVIEAARLNAEWAWAAIYRDLSPMVLRYLRAHAAPEPEDLLGEVFVQVVRKFTDFTGDGRDFRAWVLTITRNRLIDAWRRNRRNQLEFAPHWEIAERASCAGDVEEDAMRLLADERVRSIIERLTPDQRDVLFLRIFGGLTVDEVAVVVGKRPGAVKSLQTRAFTAIRRQISREAVTL